MGLIVKTAGLSLIDGALEKHKSEVLGKKEMKEVSRHLNDVLSDSLRFVEIPLAHIVSFAINPPAEGDCEHTATTSTGKNGDSVSSVVKRVDGIWYLALRSENGVIKGWHAYLLKKLKDAGLLIPNLLAKELFQVGQAIINDRSKVYRQ